MIKYTAPEMEIVTVETTDVMTASGNKLPTDGEGF